MTIPETPNQVGEEFAAGLRQSSGYDETQKLIEKEGITEATLNRTPPVGLNLRLLTEMPIMVQLRQEISSRPINAAILGIAIAEGVPDFHRFLLTALNTRWNNLFVLDIDSVILKEVDKLSLPGVIIREVDARQTQVETNSLNMVLMDHLGNCCPPVIDRQIQKEAHRILKPGGIAIINITTSELLSLSRGRKKLPFNHVRQIMGEDGIEALQTEIYDLSQLKRKFNIDLDFILKGPILEIEKDCPESVVVFGENEVGHGEWFRPLKDHLKQWKTTWGWGFDILEIKSREGNDSHNPPLRCFRHNIVLRKI
ncbi:MAG: hypothetical protein U0946_03325 [Patescibacteria group bacterium]|nr:hypothetical protein [Patescibacteria group bacterium]